MNFGLDEVGCAYYDLKFENRQVVNPSRLGFEL